MLPASRLRPVELPPPDGAGRRGRRRSERRWRYPSNPAAPTVHAEQPWPVETHAPGAVSAQEQYCRLGPRRLPIDRARLRAPAPPPTTSPPIRGPVPARRLPRTAGRRRSHVPVFRERVGDLVPSASLPFFVLLARRLRRDSTGSRPAAIGYPLPSPEGRRRSVVELPPTKQPEMCRSALLFRVVRSG